MNAVIEQQGAEKLIVGLGKTGLSCARYLRSVNVPFAVMDSRFSPPGLGEFRREFPDVELELGGFRQASLMQAGEIILSPGVSVGTPEIAAAIEAGVPVVGDIDLFSRAVDVPVVAVTGSNGKSTVVTLLGEMARHAGVRVGVGGNLDGRASMPALDLLRAGDYALYVLELSSFQLETTQNLVAEIAVILNISEDHLDRYASVTEYARAKQRIFRGARQVLINRDEPASEPAEASDARRWTYGLGEPEDDTAFGIRLVAGTPHLCAGRKAFVAVRELSLVGDHNLSNILAACALGHAVGLSLDTMTEVLHEFSGLPHRCQRIRSLQDVTFYNDSKGTNVSATVHAVRSIAAATKGKLVLIAGGIGKDADFTPLRADVEASVRELILIGRDAQELADALQNCVPMRFAGDLEEAVGLAFAVARPGDAVLLSPACSSFDMFRDYSHRGRVFTAAVEALR